MSFGRGRRQIPRKKLEKMDPLDANLNMLDISVNSLVTNARAVNAAANMVVVSWASYIKAYRLYKQENKTRYKTLLEEFTTLKEKSKKLESEIKQLRPKDKGEETLKKSDKVIENP